MIQKIADTFRIIYNLITIKRIEGNRWIILGIEEIETIQSLITKYSLLRDNRNPISPSQFLTLYMLSDIKNRAVYQLHDETINEILDWSAVEIRCISGTVSGRTHLDKYLHLVFHITRQLMLNG